MLTDHIPNQEFKNKTVFPETEIGLIPEQADNLDTFLSIGANPPASFCAFVPVSRSCLLLRSIENRDIRAIRG
jgi:hypothetical protein